MDFTGLSQTDIDSIVFSPNWTIYPLGKQPEDKGERLLLIPPSQKKLVQEIVTVFAPEEVLILSPKGIERVIRKLEKNANTRLVFISRTPWQSEVPDEDICAFFNLIKSLHDVVTISLDIFTDKAVSSHLFDSVTHPVDGVYIGLAQTLIKERPEWKVRCFSIKKLSADSLQKLLGISLPEVYDKPICIAESNYALADMLPAKLEVWPSKSLFKTQGTYLIVGGTGGLGAMLSEHLAKYYQAHLVIIGRREENWELMVRLRQAGAESVDYHQVDLTDREGLQTLVDNYPLIQGVVHSALVLEDASLTTMSEETLFRVLRPKLHGCYNLVSALKGRALDFCLFFSSIQSWIANPGQANYTAACVAKDAFADLMHNALAINSKVINWGYWGSIGVVANDHYRERMRKLKIGSIEADEGLAIIERFLASPLRQITVIKAENSALKRMNIKPHCNNKPQDLSISRAQNDSMEEIIPPFNSTHKEVEHNREISESLQEYARWRLGHITQPNVTLAKFEKLVQAIRAIPSGHSLGKEALLNKYPELAGHIKLLDHCLDHLPSILQGKIDPLSILFPEGSFELVEPVYRDNPIADYYNGIVAQIVSNFQQMHKNRPIRIIEIGAGTGSTTQFVLPKLTKDNVSYTFTDLSFSFLNKARQRFVDYPYIDYQIYNIEKSPKFEKPFDIVIATNVIHATANLPQTLSNVRQLLGKEGIFILNEITSCQDYATLTFGLTDGWWLSKDTYRIPNSPLLSSDSWRQLMLQSGFSEVGSHGSEEQQVIVGFSHQVVKNKQVNDLGHSSQVELKAFLRQVIADVLHFEENEIEENIPFNEMGIDSLISMELLKPIREIVSYVSATVLFEYPTVRQLAEHLQIQGATLKKSIVQNATFQEAKFPLDAFHKEGIELAVEGSLNKDVTAQVAKIIADTMMMEMADIELDTPFQEYGVDSIISLELIRPLKNVFGHLPATILFEYPTLRQLSEHLSASTKIGTSTKSLDKEYRQSTPTSNRGMHLGVTDGGKTFLPDDIAIIGMSGRLPQSENISELWMNLRQGRDCTSTIPTERWDVEKYLTNTPLNGRGSYTTQGAFIANPDAFDHEFFHLTPKESARIDPQERIMLEQVYRVILDSGYTRNQLAGSETGIYVGVMNGDYAWHTPVDESVNHPTSLFWSIANRASYHFDWRGPSMAIDTACSASLTAIHLACQALRNGDCQQAVVGGVNLITHPRHFEQLCGLHMLSPSEQCKPFGAKADGFVDGEGVICLMLKRAEDAFADNDRIYAIVKGSAINAGGRSNGYTAPNPEAQTALIHKALKAAKVSPTDISYVEAHGTGTELGDPIELRALSNGYEKAARQSIRLGSIKSNIGHLESAAGLSGVVKAVLQMWNREFVPSLNAEQLNPHLDFENSPFSLNRKLQSWDSSLPLYSAVSSFGAGGSNAHIILQGVANPLNAAIPTLDVKDDRIYVIPISHHSSAGLQLTIDGLLNWLRKNQTSLAELAYTLACTRDHEKHRQIFVCQSQQELIEQLSCDLQQPSKFNKLKFFSQEKLPKRLTVDNVAEIASLYLSGAKLPWSDYYQHRKFIQLPEYVFIRHRHWINSLESKFNGLDSLTAAHMIHGKNMAPAAWFLSELCEKGAGNIFNNIVWKKKIHSPKLIRLEEDKGIFRLVSQEDKQIFSSAEQILGDTAKIIDSKLPDITAFGDSLRLSRQQIYDDFNQRGYCYDQSLQGIQWAQVKQSMIRASLHVDRDWGHLVSPALLDAGLQLAILMPKPKTEDNAQTFVPWQMSNMFVHRIPNNEAIYCYCFEREGSASPQARIFDFWFTDQNHQLLIKLEELVSVVIQPEVEKTSSKFLQSSEAEDNFEVFNIS
ncbi:SDR family NAD(P)-dependent oxidoreductase [Xenorhabdus sp. KJ12.1]|uniref:SDR family NAD(P)-dependent oxidoreductase n=1 Tax=Xenorhabdus sp. KJ12.1 TaxID=1851571 RepID=UPI000C03C543|nr:SDR family NAD(P)-dependent oxidoreductase [Xenorhabdus sp. KJ12.1]PHM67147.1 type I modular polyketide synthase [Xenorhabdus sp. KJ12.1]